MSANLTDETRILVIYTGGTIGMLVGHQGYVPEPYFLTETLRSQSQFHDPLQNSLFSNSSSVQGFRDWSSSSGRTTPLQQNAPPPSVASPVLPTLLVRSSRPIGKTSSLSANRKELFPDRPVCHQVSENIYEAHIPSLVTPRNTVHGANGSKSIRYAILEWDPLLDSSNIEIDDWIRMATEIELNYQSFDAFVILHGTDTMSYTTSALSFLLEDLGKTVIITGAQIPLSQLRNDATDNLMGALTIAGHFVIPECSLFFNHTLFRGNRVSKVSSYDLSAFDSPNFSPLVNVGIDIVVNWNEVIRQTSLRRFRAHKELSPHVATLRLFPGITAATVKAFVRSPTRGVVLESFGAGNAPQRVDLMTTLKGACDSGVVIVAISQCAKGSVSDAYETGRSLMQCGVVPGGDMTPECALAKLSYLLSKPELSVDEVRMLMGTPLRGELTRTVASSTTQPAIGQNMENIQDVLSHFVRLSLPQKPPVPQIVVSSSQLDETSNNATAPWSLTAGEAASTEAVLFPFLVHLACSKNDLDGLHFCLASTAPPDTHNTDSPVIEASTPSYGRVGGGLANSIDPGSGRTPLHVAALNGNTDCVDILLHAGALVHIRDNLGHTALYYAARQGHTDVAKVLTQAGAILGVVDSNFVSLALSTAIRNGDMQGIETWAAAGVKMPQTE